MTHSITMNRRTITLGTTALASAALLRGNAFAQDATPPATPGGPPEGFPVAIYSGSCGDLSDQPAYELGNAVTFGVPGGGDPQTIGGDEGVRTVVSAVSGTVDSDLQTLGDEGHAIVIHSSQEDLTVIACGNVAGAISNGTLVVALAPVEPSTVVGIAVLEEGDGEVEVTAYVFDTSVAENVPATPAS